MARVKGVPSWYTGDTSGLLYKNKLPDRQAYDDNINDFINFTKQVDAQRQQKFDSSSIANEIMNTPAQIQQQKPIYSEQRIEDMYKAFGNQIPLTAAQITAKNQKAASVTDPLQNWNKLSVWDKTKMAITNPNKFMQMQNDASDEQDAQELQKNPNRDSNDIFAGMRNNNTVPNAINNNTVVKAFANSAPNKFMQQASVGGIKTLFGDNTVSAPSTGNNTVDKVAQFLGGVAAFGVNPGNVGGGMTGGSLNEGTNIIGNALEKHTAKLTGSVLGSSAVQALSPAAQKALKVGLDYGSNAVRSGAEFAGINAGQTALQGGNGKQIAQAAGQGFGQGAAFGTAFKGLGDLGGLILKKISPADIEVKNTETPDNMTATTKENSATPKLKPGTYQVKNTQLEKAINDYNNAIEQIHNHFQQSKLTPDEVARIKPELGIDLDKLTANIEKYQSGANVKEIGNSANWRSVVGLNKLPDKLTPTDRLNPFVENNAEVKGKITPIAKNTLNNDKVVMPEVAPTDNLKLSRFSNETVKNSPLTNPEISKELNSEYNPITNKDTVIQAQKIINTDPIKAKEWVMSEQPSTATQNATAQLLVKQAQDEGRYGDAIDMIEKVSKKATKQGQAIQALSLWNKLTPEGMLKFAQRTVDKANLELPVNKKIKLTDDLAKDITDSMKEIQKMPEGIAKNEATQVVLKKVADQVPSSIWKKIDTIQTMAQLLNLKTSIRNVGGNGGMMINENLSNIVGTPIDILTSKLTGKRTVGLPSLVTQAKGYVGGLKEGIRQTKLGIPEDSTQFDLPQQKVFSDKNIAGRILNTGQKVLDYMLRVPDQASKKAIYDDSLRSQMKLAGATTPTEEMIQAANNDAKYGTFQDDTNLSKAFSVLKNKVLNGGKDWGLGSMVLKYPKTPANIIMRAIDYSPAGFFKATYRLAEPLFKGIPEGKTFSDVFDQRAFVQDTSRALVGTGNLIGTGYLFTKLGIMTGKSSDDTDTAAMQKQVGLGDYKLNLSALRRFVLSGFNTDKAKPQQGDKLINYDWLQPASIGLAIGANMADSQKKGIVSIASNIADSLNSGLNTLMQQPLISGLTSALQQRDAGKMITSTIKGVPASVVPTVLKQIAQLFDNTSRSTYTQNWEGQMGNLVKSKIPGLSNTLQPKLDTFGHEQKAYENNNPLNVFLNPAFTSTYKVNPAAELPLDIFKQTGNKTLMPRLSDNYIMYKGQKVQLTPQEYTDLQKYIGNETEKEYNDFMNFNQNNTYSNDEKIKMLQQILNKINKEGRNRILEKRGLD